MKTKLRTSFLTTSALLFGISTGCFAVNIPEQVDINLQSSNPALSSTGKDSKNVPNFSHAQHASVSLKNNNAHASMAYSNEFTCAACHIGVTTTEEVQSEAASQRQAEAVEQAGGVKKYMHGICLDCHKSMKKAKIATGPTSCKGCHKAS